MKSKLVLLIVLTASLVACQPKKDLRPKVEGVAQTHSLSPTVGENEGVGSPVLDADPPSAKEPVEEKRLDPASLKITPDTKLFYPLDTLSEFKLKPIEQLKSEKCVNLKRSLGVKEGLEYLKNFEPNTLEDMYADWVFIGVPIKATRYTLCEKDGWSKYGNYDEFDIYVLYSLRGNVPLGVQKLIYPATSTQRISLREDTIYIFSAYRIENGALVMDSTLQVALEDYLPAMKKDDNAPSSTTVYRRNPIPYRYTSGEPVKLHVVDLGSIAGLSDKDLLPYKKCPVLLSYGYNGTTMDENPSYRTPRKIEDLLEHFSGLDTFPRKRREEHLEILIKNMNISLKQTLGKPGEPCDLEEYYRRKDEEERILEEKLTPKPKKVRCDTCEGGYEYEDLSIEEYMKEKARLQKLYGKKGGK